MARRKRKPRGSCLLLVDVINAFDFPDSEGLARAARRAATSIEELAARARAEGVPVVYVNDNFGQWRSNFMELVRECTQPRYPGAAVSERLRPQDGDYFVLKPQHSGFYSTPLDLLLDHLGAHTLVLAGFAANLCIAFTANDAHMRGFHLSVPRDCVASNTPRLTRDALRHMECALRADTRPAAEVDFRSLEGRHRKPRGQPF